MNDKFDDFSDVVNNVKIERKRTPFEINQIKLEHFHWNFGDIDVGVPKTTSVELTCNYNFEKEKLVWKKIVSHTYFILEKDKECNVDTYEEELADSNKLIEEIQKYDLRDLKNNYFTDVNPNRFTHWELTYNNYFKIVGTYDQNIVEFERISELLHFKAIIEEELRKVQTKFQNM